MKNKYIALLMTASLSLLSACGGGSSTTASTTPAADYSALWQAIIDHPDQAMEIAPTFFYEQPSCMPTPDPVTGLMQVSVTCLEQMYEAAFCQLNAKQGVTLSSPQCQANIAYIKSQSGSGNFDLLAKPILNNPLGVTGVLFQKVNYSTTVLLPAGPQTFTVSGGLILPQGITGDKVKGVITYFHATAFNKSKVGSNFSENGETQHVAEVFASQGYIVVIPDYVGQGDDWQNVHPYVLYPQVSNKTAVDMLSAVAPTIRAAYTGLPSQLKLFSAGYSEGGAYSAWFPSFLQANPSTLDSLYLFKHSVGMEGAYATSAVMKDYLFGNVSFLPLNKYNIEWQVLPNVSKPLLSADAFLSYATYQFGGDMSSVFNADFYNMNCPIGNPPGQDPLCNAVPPTSSTGSNTQGTIAQAFAQQNKSPAITVLLSALSKTANSSTYPSLANIMTSDLNSVNSLVSSTLINSGQATLNTVLTNAQVNLSSFTSKPVSILSLDYDSVVTPNNYSWLLETYPNQIYSHYLLPAQTLQVVSPMSKYLPKPTYVNVDHLQGLTYEFLYALNIFNQF